MSSSSSSSSSSRAGGATGAGAALDAATRGLSTALVEGEDFASGTSSRSTKLVHGGVRYLEKAVFQLDPGQLKLVFEALRERKTLLRNAPHLARALPIATPCYRLWEVPYYYAGMKAYDVIAAAGGGALTSSRFVGARDSLADFPTLAATRGDDDDEGGGGATGGGPTLKGTIVYTDGQFDDARMCVALACTASAAGATVANYVRVNSLIRDERTGRVVGARCVDVSEDAAAASEWDWSSGTDSSSKRRRRRGREFEVRARVVVNATGPFTDGVRRMSADADAAKKTKKKKNTEEEDASSSVVPETIMTPAGGVHVTLPGHFAPPNAGLIVPKTKDGRVVFMLPWLGAVVAGTTDKVTDVTLRPRATREEVDFILESLAPYLSAPATRADVTSAWSGIRPLAKDPTAGKNGGGTENMSRDHLVVDEGDGMITVTGGKWTTYRLMAEHAIDAAIEVEIPNGANPNPPGGGGGGGGGGGEENLNAPPPPPSTTTLASKASACVTRDVAMIGSHGYARDLASRLARPSSPSGDVGEEALSSSSPRPLDADVAAHLARSYGDRAPRVAALAERAKVLRARLAGPSHPVIAAEVVHAARSEYCVTACDFIARRTRLAFLDVEAASAAVPLVVRVLQRELGWSRRRARREMESARAFLATFRA